MQQHIVGLNVLRSLFKNAIETCNPTSINCVAYNVNLDYVRDLALHYDVTINIYTNRENITLKNTNQESIRELIEDKKIVLKSISVNEAVIHSKIYSFVSNGEIKLMAIGSPNLSYESNNNIESVVILDQKQIMNELWDSFLSSQQLLNIEFDKRLPEILMPVEDIGYSLDPNILDDLWSHQKQIITWLAQKTNSIINIPPGTGKTKTALSYLSHINNNDDNVTTIVLVPTKALIEQWMGILSELGFKCYELKNDFSNLTSYFPNPRKKIIVTLYSRFIDAMDPFARKINLLNPNMLMIYDECHNIYNNIDKFNRFYRKIQKNNKKLYKIGLSATIDTFDKNKLEYFYEHMGGRKNQYQINLPSFYSIWNNKNSRPILKEIDYIPLRYKLTTPEMLEYNSFSGRIAAQMNINNIDSDTNATAAIQRAMWLRSLNGGISTLENYITANMDLFENKTTVIFVQSNAIAQRVQKLLINQPAWSKSSSVYIYDSKQPERYRDIALREFKKGLGFCLVAERMLAEGFDLPKIDSIILHGSHRSERDWIQKIGRAIRFNQEEPKAVASIIDIVFCDENGTPLSLETERFNVLSSISR